MDISRLITTVDINGVECEINTDFRDIIEILQILDDPDLLEQERVGVALSYFYRDTAYLSDIPLAIKLMNQFITMSNGAEEPSSSSAKSQRLYDWGQDYNIIIAPINTILGYDVRGKEYLHWWTFFSAFMEIGESTFHTYVAIRDKLNNARKLEKYEEKILKEHRNSIILKKRVDSETQSLMDEIMGVV